jgi:hypothetical protein
MFTILSSDLPLVQLYTGWPPFWGMSQVAAMFKIVSGERPERPEAMSDVLWNVVTVAWAQDFRTRPRIGEVVHMLRGLVPGLFIVN